VIPIIEQIVVALGEEAVLALIKRGADHPDTSELQRNAVRAIAAEPLPTDAIEAKLSRR
jgi:hypothetical protein